MTVYSFQFIALDSQGEQIPNAVGSFYVSSDNAFLSPVQVTGQDGVLTSTPTANRLGLVTFSYDGDEPRGWWKSGDQSIPVTAREAADTAAAAAVAAQAAAEAAAANTTAPTESAVRSVITADLADPSTDVSESVASVAASAVSTALAPIAPDNGSRAVGKGELVANVRDYGAKGDGTTDDTAAVQAALNAAGSASGSVFAPAGRYLCGAITVPSGVNFYGTPGTTFVIKSSTSSNWLTVQGSLGSEVPLAAAATSGDTALTTTTAHGLVAGDLGRLVSQRDALSSDAGPDWRLGNNTPTSTTCYFGEIIRITTAPSSTSLTLDVGLLFPNYRPDKTLEAATTARNSATIAKFNAASHVRIKGFTIEGSPTTAATSAIFVQLGYDVLVEDIIHRPTGSGFTVVFEASLECYAQHCRVFYPDVLTAGGPDRNAFKCHGSQNCGYIRCHGERATQTFDLTYSGLLPRLPSVSCYIEGCSSKGAISNAVTTHSGTYGSRIIDNRLHQNRSNGIACRSRNAIVTGNHVYGSRVVGSYGIELYEGWARNSLVAGNIVHGFDLGIAVQDGSDATNEIFTWIGAKITNNTVTMFGSYGISVQRAAANQYVGESGLTINLNHLVGCWQPGAVAPKGIYTGKYVVGARVKDNTIDLASLGAAGIQVPANGAGAHIEGNTVLNSANRGVWLDTPTDSTAWPSGVTVTLGTGNRIVNSPTQYFLGSGVTIPSKFNQGGASGAGSVIAVTGSRGGNAAVASLLTQLAAAGLITDSTTA